MIVIVRRVIKKVFCIASNRGAQTPDATSVQRPPVSCDSHRRRRRCRTPRPRPPTATPTDEQTEDRQDSAGRLESERASEMHKSKRMRNVCVRARVRACVSITYVSKQRERSQHSTRNGSTLIAVNAPGSSAFARARGWMPRNEMVDGKKYIQEATKGAAPCVFVVVCVVHKYLKPLRAYVTMMCSNTIQIQIV